MLFLVFLNLAWWWLPGMASFRARDAHWLPCIRAHQHSPCFLMPGGVSYQRDSGSTAIIASQPLGVASKEVVPIGVTCTASHCLYAPLTSDIPCKAPKLVSTHTDWLLSNDTPSFLEERSLGHQSLEQNQCWAGWGLSSKESLPPSSLTFKAISDGSGQPRHGSLLSPPVPTRNPLTESHCSPLTTQFGVSAQNLKLSMCGLETAQSLWTPCSIIGGMEDFWSAGFTRKKLVTNRYISFSFYKREKANIKQQKAHTWSWRFFLDNVQIYRTLEL